MIANANARCEEGPAFLPEEQAPPTAREIYYDTLNPKFDPARLGGNPPTFGGRYNSPIDRQRRPTTTAGRSVSDMGPVGPSLSRLLLHLH